MSIVTWGGLEFNMMTFSIIDNKPHYKVSYLDVLDMVTKHCRDHGLTINSIKLYLDDYDDGMYMEYCADVLIEIEIPYEEPK